MEEVQGCWQEAKRADQAAVQLLRIRAALGLEFFEQITAVLREIESASRLLRDLYDLFPIYSSRVPMILYYLNIVLPSLCKTIQNMMIYIDNDAFPAHTQWALVCERLGDQGGMTLPTRFVMYVDFLVQLVRLLSRSPLYDPTTLELLRLRHLRLRQSQCIPAPPVYAVPHHAPIQLTEADLESKQRRHWAEKIFDDQPLSTTGLRHRRESMCFGPPMVDIKLGISVGSSVLFKLPFDKNRLSVTLYLHPQAPDMTRILCRWLDPYMNPLTACYGVHELCVRRKGAALQFRRWGQKEMSPKLWMALFFKTWEKLVLFHSAFAALKSRCPLTISVTPDDVVLMGEKKLFQGTIVDDGFEHSLTVLQDEKCGGIRLHAAVKSGELKRCPVWTAFVTRESESPQWLERRSRHRIWLRDIRPYVFCQNYQKRHQMRQGGGVFELYFVAEAAADAFQDTFTDGSSDRGSLVEVPQMSGANGP
ncbi:hypothetical protein LZ554_005005 [Drepanopeziza brunnea f. sp. 'monogermtubi']|nr:hypothetical protein LZ554_005005 [Drepanopeziza brunnea f. sp. 'monogermtubi']